MCFSFSGHREQSHGAEQTNGTFRRDRAKIVRHVRQLRTFTTFSSFRQHFTDDVTQSKEEMTGNNTDCQNKIQSKGGKRDRKWSGRSKASAREEKKKDNRKWRTWRVTCAAAVSAALRIRHWTSRDASQHPAVSSLLGAGPVQKQLYWLLLVKLDHVLWIPSSWTDANWC